MRASTHSQIANNASMAAVRDWTAVVPGAALAIA
jgi:hypothetical protein